MGGFSRRCPTGLLRESRGDVLTIVSLRYSLIEASAPTAVGLRIASTAEDGNLIRREVDVF